MTIIQNTQNCDDVVIDTKYIIFINNKCACADYHFRTLATSLRTQLQQTYLSQFGLSCSAAANLISTSQAVSSCGNLSTRTITTHVHGRAHVLSILSVAPRFLHLVDLHIPNAIIIDWTDARPGGDIRFTLRKHRRYPDVFLADASALLQTDHAFHEAYNCNCRVIYPTQDSDYQIKRDCATKVPTSMDIPPLATALLLRLDNM